MPSIRYSIDASGADRGARQWGSAIDRVVADARRAAQAIEALDRATRGMGQAAGAMSPTIARVTQASQQVQRAAQASAAGVEGLSGAMRNMSSAAALSFGPLSGLGSRFTAVGSLATRNSVALGGVIAAVTGVGAAFAVAVHQAADFESAMLRVGKVTNATTAELKVQSADVLKLSSSLGVPAGELAKIEESAARLGIRGSQNLATFAAEIAKLTRTTDLDAEGLSTQLAQFLNLTKLAPSEITKVSSAVTALGNNFAASEGKIISMALELARGSAAFNVGSDKLLALSASLAAVGERSERSGTALTQVLIGITQAAAGGKHLEDFARLLGVTKEKFQELSKQDVGQVFIEVLKRLQAEGPAAINVLQQLHLGSSRNFKVLLTQAQAIDEVGRALGIVRAQYANATATDQEFTRMNEALNRQLEIAGVQLTNMGIVLGTQLIPLLTGGLKGFNDLLSLLQGIPPPTGEASRQMQLLAGSIVLVSDAVATQVPALRLMLDLLGNLATLNPATAFQNSLAAFERYGQGVKEAYSRIGADIAALENGRPLKLKIFDDAQKDAQDARVVSGAVNELKGTVENATRAPDALSAALSNLSKSNEHVGATFDKSADAVKKALAAMDGDIAAKKALATQGEAAAKAQEVINKLTEKGITVSDADRAAILAKAQALVGWSGSAKAAAKDAKDAARAMETLDKGLSAVQRDLEKQLKLVGLDEGQKEVVELTAKIEDLRAKAVEGGADEAKAREAANKALAEAIPLQDELNRKKAEEARGDVLRGLQEEVELRRIEIDQGKIAADTQKIINDLKKEGVQVDEKYTASIREQLVALQKLEDTGRDAWKGIDDAFQQTLDGLINGTLEMSEVWKSFTLGLLKDFADSMGGVSGIAGAALKGIKGLFTGNTGSTDKNGNPTSFLGSIGGGIDRFRDPVYARNADGSIVKDAKGNPVQALNPDGTPQTSFNFGAAAGAAAQGGITAYSMFRATEDTKLEGLIAKGTERGVLSASNGIGQVVGTIVGAVASIYLGPLGGVLGAAVGSGFAALIAGSVTRKTFLKGEYSGFMGVGQNAFNPGKLSTSFLAGIPLAQEAAWTSYKLFDAILNLPSLGLALRKGGESLLDNSETFKGAQARFGDITVRSGGPEDVYRNNLTGGDTARERGFTPGQVDLTKGATAAIFSQLTEGEVSEDAGRLGEAMGNIMAEFLSRGLEEGVDFEPMFDLLRQFAHEAGIDLLTTVKSLNDVMANSISAAQTWGKLDPMAAATQGARAYAEALVGATEVFRDDYPAGVNVTAIALRNLEKDGVNAFGEIDDEAKKTLDNLAKDTELTTDVIAKLVEQGFTINTDEFERQLEVISASATELGGSIDDLFGASNFGEGINSILAHLKTTLKTQLGGEFMKQLFDSTSFAEIFAPVFEVQRKLKEGEFDLTSGDGRTSYRNEIVTAIAEGRANLEEYLPILREMYENWKDIEAEIDKALEPTQAEKLAEAIGGAFSGLGSLFSEAIDAGVEVLSSGGSFDAAMTAFNSKFGTGLQTALKTAVFNAILDTAIIQPMIARYQPAFTYVAQAGLAYGFTDPRVQAAWNLLMGQIQSDAASVGPLLLQSAADANGLDHGLTKFFAKMQADIDEINRSLAGTFTSTITGAITEAMKSGKAIDFDDLRENLHAAVYEAVVNAMVEAMVSAAVIEGGLAPLLEELKVKSADAWRDGFLSDSEKSGLAQIVGRIGKAGLELADVLITGLGPVLELIGGLPGVDVGGKKNGHYEARGGDIVFVEDGRERSFDNIGNQPAPGRDSFQVDVADGGREIVEKQIKPPAEAFSDAMTNLVVPGLEKMDDAVGGVTEALDALQRLFKAAGGSETGTGTDTGTGTGPGTGPGRGLPDTNTAAAATASMLADDGAATQGRDFPGHVAPGTRGPIPPTPTDRGNGRPGGPVKVPPPPGTHPGSGAAGAVTVEVSAALSDAIEAFLRGGSLTEFETALEDGSKNAVLEGLIKGMLESGPIKTALDSFNKQMSDAVTKAMRDGVIDAKEQADLAALAEKLAGDIDAATQKMKPAVDAVVKALGIGLEQSVDSNVREGLESAFRDFLTSGDVDAANEAIHKTFREAALNGIIDALLAEGPIADAVEAAGTTFRDAFRDVMADGVISPDEAAHLRDLGIQLGTDLEAAFSGLDPAFAAIFETLREGTTSAVKQAADLLSGSLKGLLSDPANLNFQAFSASLRQAIYQNVAGGLVDAFIDAAITQGALAPMLAAIQTIFEQIGKRQIDIATANGAIAEQIALMLGVLKDPAFKEAIDTLLKGIKEIGNQLNAFPQAAGGVADAAGAVSDAVNQAQEDVCAGKCGLKEETTNLGQTVLDASGRIGEIEDIVWRSKYAGGSTAADAAMADTLGGGDGSYGWLGSDTDWRRAARSHRRQRRFDGVNDGPDGQYGYYGPGYDGSGAATNLITDGATTESVPFTDSGSDSGDLAALVEEMRDEIKELREALASQPIIVKGEVKVGEDKVIDVMMKAKRTARASGYQL